ncbi:MAG: Threonine dehydrogenase [Candidatus Kentron sp. G]|nr:MAG: Threonine dehydrogenase [Candidatus Kentron sp. G]
MRALYFDRILQFRDDFPCPASPPGEALIRTRLAGICNTDLEIMRGYEGFYGVLGHEFVGEVVWAGEDSDWTGKRVVGEINCYCGQCSVCRRGNPKTEGEALERLLSDGEPASGREAASGPPAPGSIHCPNRTTLGIYGRHGVMADFFALPTRLLYAVPDSVTDEQAVFVEPLAAACKIVEQVPIRPHHRVVVLGDGKLGLLIGQVLQMTGCDLLVAGRHPRKLAILARRGIRTYQMKESTLLSGIEPGPDIVVEATGRAAGFAMALALVRSGGTLVLKSTFHGEIGLDSSRIVVDEITIVGSRCGPFAPAIRLLERGLVDVESLIEGRFPLEDGLSAFDRAASGALKVLISTESVI